MSLIPKFFGQYLLEKGVLNKDQLIDAINYQKSKILKMGEIATSQNYLSEKQVAKIHNEQKRTDMRFGDLAVQMGMLTQTQLEEIITIQKNNHIYLGEAIVTCGHMDDETLEKELDAFKNEQRAVPPIEVIINEDVPVKEFVEVSVDLTEKMMRRIGDMISKSGQLKLEKEGIKNLGVISYLEFKGDINARYVINISWEVGQELAKKTFKKEDLPFDEELIKDTLAEFVNVVCGNIRSKMLEQGKKMEFQPPVSFTEKTNDVLKIDSSEHATIVPGYTQLGNYELVVVSKK